MRGNSALIIVEAVISERGAVEDVRMLKPIADPTACELAMNVVRGMQFAPAKLFGYPVRGVYNVSVKAEKKSVPRESKRDLQHGEFGPQHCKLIPVSRRPRCRTIDGIQQIDVFLSYNSRDYEAVRTIARSLLDRGLKVFVDRWYLVPGMLWPEHLEQILGQSRAVAVLVGPHGMGRWQQREQYVALDRKAREPNFPVIPVLLPGSDPALGFLFLNTWVDLRERTDDPNGLRILAGAIDGHAPGPEVLQRTLTAQSTVCPYRGLRYFREEDAPFFFGRDAFIERLTVAVGDRRPLVAVVGASGSGKSSVVRAGLTPRLRDTKGSTVWEIATIVPGDRPLRALAAAMSPLLEPELNEIGRLRNVAELAEAFATRKIALRDVVARAIEKQRGTNRLMLIVDQWEEIYTQTRDEPARHGFIDAILDATSSSPLSVVLTMRGDFFGHALGYRPFSDAIQDSVVNVSQMTNAELASVIEKPAAKIGLRFEPGLVTRILEHVSEEPGNLPLLEFVLTELWKERDEELLTHSAYAKIGGVHGAIAAHAETAFLSLAPGDQEIARRVLLQLVRPGTGDDGPTRRRIAFSELAPESISTVRELADAHLVVTGRSEATSEELVDVVHEALIEAWTRLRDWIDEDREFLEWRERLRALIAIDEPALMQGRRLSEARQWLQKRGTDLSTSERTFLETSVWLDENRDFLAWREQLRALMESDAPARMKGLQLEEAKKWLAEHRDDLSMAAQEFIEKSVWLDENREFLEWRERLRTLVANDAPSPLKGHQLAVATAWLTKHRADLSRADQEFIERSVRHERNRNLQLTLLAISLLIAFAVTPTVLEWLGNRRKPQARTTGSETSTTATTTITDTTGTSDISEPAVPPESEELATIRRLLGVSSLGMRGPVSLALVGPPPPDGTLPRNQMIVIENEHLSRIEWDRHQRLYSSQMVQGVLTIAPKTRFVFISMRPDSHSDRVLLEALGQMQRRNINPRVLLIPYRFLDQDAGTRTIDFAVSAGLLVVASGGNKRRPSPVPTPPSWNVPPNKTFLSVGAVNAHGDVSQSSSRMDGFVWAPGENIPWMDQGKIDQSTGTGVASALAAGVAIRIYDRHPNISTNDIRDVLRKTARPAVPNGPPILNLDASLAEAQQSQPSSSVRMMSAFVKRPGTVVGIKTAHVSGAPTDYVISVQERAESESRVISTWRARDLERADQTVTLKNVRGYDFVLRAAIRADISIDVMISFDGRASRRTRLILKATDGPIVVRQWLIVVKGVSQLE